MTCRRNSTRGLVRWLGASLLALTVCACSAEDGSSGADEGSGPGDYNNGHVSGGISSNGSGVVDDGGGFISDSPGGGNGFITSGGSGGIGTGGTSGGSVGGTTGASTPPSDDGGMDPVRAISEADIVQVRGDTLYALSRYAGLSIIDISAPTQLRMLGQRAWSGHSLRCEQRPRDHDGLRR